MGNFFEDVGRTGVLKETIGGILSSRQQKQESAIAQQNQNIKLQELDVLKSQEGRAAQEHQAKVDRENRLVPLSTIMDKLPGKESQKQVRKLFSPGTVQTIGDTEYAPQKEFFNVRQILGTQHETTMAVMDSGIADLSAKIIANNNALNNPEKPLTGTKRDEVIKENEQLKLQVAENASVRNKANSVHSQALDKIKAEAAIRTPQETPQQKEDRAVSTAKRIQASKPVKDSEKITKLKLNAWNAFFTGTATSKHKRMIGVDRDPLKVEIAKAVNSDMRNMKLTDIEKVQRIEELYNSMRSADDQGGDDLGNQIKAQYPEAYQGTDGNWYVDQNGQQHRIERDQ